MQNVSDAPDLLRVVVADDIAVSREQLCGLVRALGHQVFAVSSGTAALTEVLQRDPDVVLMDLLMPDMDGFDATQRIRELVQDRWLPVIVTSSLAGEEHFIHALQRGADDYLARPINPNLLAAKLRHYARVLGLQSSLAGLARRQRAIQDNILDAVVTTDASGIVEDCNLAACHLVARDRNGLLGRSCREVLGFPLEVLLSPGDLSFSRADGSQFPVELACSEWSQAGHTHYTLVIRDLTERRHIERMKDEFLATVSHELRTPLTSILGALGLLGSGAAGALPPAAKPMAEVAKRNAERLSRLIDDVLDLTKLEGNRMSLQLRPTPLDGLLKESVTANLGYAARSGVVLDLQLASGCPQVRVDPDRILQVMANVLSNAIKHSPNGGTVQVQLIWQAPIVQIKVRDQGPGIDPKFRARMFEKFSQADGSDRRAQGGTGLGLYITRMLVERMGGRIGVEAGEQAGAVFVLEFPVSEALARPGAVKLLHIDRDIDARHRVAEWLRPLCRVDGVSDLAEARAQPDLTAYRLVLADPQSQGQAEEFCRGLRRLLPDARLLVFSDAVDAGFAQGQELQWLKKSGMARDHLQQTVQDAMRLAPHRS
ncbi:MAG: response regulator [Rhodoferax sp.]|nr:response regulator [Rhodoferax sp.]